MRLMEDFTPSVRSGNTGYAGNVVLKDGTYVLTSYGYFDSQDTRAPYIVTVRLKLSELDAPCEQIAAALQAAKAAANEAVVGTESAISKLRNVQVVEAATHKPGQVHMIIAGIGAEHAISSDVDIVAMTWRAKPITEADTGQIHTIQAIVGNAEGMETNASLAALQIQVSPNKPNMPGDVNGDGKVSIGDLGLIAAHYGKTAADPQWQSFKHADITGDGSIDIEDLVRAARMMIE